jgi:hypothetical protein
MIGVRPLALVLALGSALLAACGPDCALFCKRLRDCELIVNTGDAEQDCVHGCGEVGGDYQATVRCVNDTSHSCDDLKRGHCGPLGQRIQ